MSKNLSEKFKEDNRLFDKMQENAARAIANNRRAAAQRADITQLNPIKAPEKNLEIQAEIVKLDESPKNALFDFLFWIANFFMAHPVYNAIFLVLVLAAFYLFNKFSSKSIITKGSSTIQSNIINKTKKTK